MKRNYPGRKQVRGTAILMALFFVALVTSISLSWYLQSRIAVKRTQQMLLGDQNNLYVQLILNQAIHSLVKALTEEASSKKITMPIKFKYVLSKQVILAGKIEDYQARLNVNNVTELETKTAFIRLILLLDPKSTPASASELAGAIIAWISPIRNLSEAQLQINAIYSKKNPAYRAANRPFFSLSELRLVQGMTAVLFSALEPYLCALPVKTPFNPEHSSSLILDSFKLTPSQLPVTVKSEYFLIQAEIKSPRSEMLTYTLAHLVKEAGEWRAETVWQSRGTV